MYFFSKERPTTRSFSSLTSLKGFGIISRQASSIRNRQGSSFSYNKDDTRLTSEDANTTAEPGRSSNLSLQHSSFSSFDSVALNKSAVSYQSSDPTTPSPAKPRRLLQGLHGKPLNEEPMGQNGSTIRRRRGPEKPDLDCFSTSPPRSPDTSPQKASGETTSAEITSAEQGPDQTLTRRPSSALVPIPRRRSSLTALHLDSSHFETPIAGQDVLKHRASTLTSTYKQDAKSTDTITPLDKAVTRDTLSPPMLSPLSSDTRRSISSDIFPSPASPVPSHIHLPKTFPNGPVPTPRPPLTDLHHRCYTYHHQMPRSNNRIYPVPCMTCGTIQGDLYWKCVWCYLRICGECMAEFTGRGRKLDVLLAWIERRKNQPMSEQEIRLKEKAGNQSWGKAKGKRVKQLSEGKEAEVVLREVLERPGGSPLRNSTG